MSEPAILYLSSAKSVDPNHIGEVAYQLWKAHQDGVEIVPTVVLPVNILKNIAQKNNLAQHWQEIASITDWQDPVSLDVASQQLQSKIKQMIIDPELVDQLVRVYHHVLNQKKSRVGYSPIGHLPTQLNTLAINSESELIETILNVWADYFSTSRLRPGLDELYPDITPRAAVIIQPIVPANMTGIYQTKQPISNRKDKFAVEIFHGNNQTQDHRGHHCEYDINTNQIDDLARGGVVAAQRPHLHQAGKHTHQLKKQSLDHLQTHWEFTDHAPMLRSILQYQEPTPATQSKVILGQKLVTGETTGVPVSSPKLNLAKSQILVSNSLSYKDLPHVQRLSGLVLATRPSQLVLETLQTFGIPTILVGENQLPKILAANNLNLNADRGQIHLLSSNKTNFSTNLHSGWEIWQVGGNPATAELVSAQPSTKIIFDVDYLSSKLGDHPNQPYKSVSDRIVRLASFYQKSGFKHLLFKSPSRYQENQTLTNHLLSHTPALVDELNQLTKLSTRTELKISWMPQQIRTVSEWSLLKHQLDTHCNKQQTHVSMWLQIEFPSLVFQLSEYLSQNPAGIMVDIEKLHSNLIGIDQTNGQKHIEYPLDIKLIAKAINDINHLRLNANYQLPLIIQLDKYRPNLIELVSDKVDGFACQPMHTLPIKRLLTTE